MNCIVHRDSGKLCDVFQRGTSVTLIQKKNLYQMPERITTPLNNDWHLYSSILCICIYACVLVFMYVSIIICMDVCIYVCMVVCLCMRSSMSSCMYVCYNVFVFQRTRTYCTCT